MVRDIGWVTATDGSHLLRMWQVSVPAGGRPLRLHSHIAFEISAVAAGSGTYTVGEKTYSMQPGDMFVLAGNEQHCITQVGSAGLTLINCHFEPRYLWGHSTDSLSEANSNFCFAHSDSFENRIPADKAGGLRPLFDGIREELTARQPEYAMQVKSYLNLLIVHLLRKMGYGQGSSPISRSRLHSIRRVLQHIDRHLAEELSLADLAQLAGMSPNYFSTLFRSVSGIALWEYISMKRIDLAIRLLTEEEPRTMLEIAGLCGFNNTANFNKTFKKITGLTPTEYRRGDNIGI